MASKQDFQPLLDAQQNHLGLVFNYSDALDSRILAILGVNVAVMLYAAQVLPQLPSLMKVGVFVAYVGSVLVNIMSVLLRDYIGASVDIEAHPEYLSMAEDDLVLQLISDTQYAINHNTIQNAAKQRLCITSIAASVFGAVLLIWGILLV